MTVKELKEPSMEVICNEYNEAARLYHHEGKRIENKDEIIQTYGKGVFNFLKYFENHNNSTMQEGEI